MDADSPEVSGSGSSKEYKSGVRLVVLNLPEDEGEGLGFRLTRTLWDPYPWVRDVTAGSRADHAGLQVGDCLLQADGKDLLGLPVGQVAGLIRGDGAGRGVSLLAWNCGVDPKEDPELLWSCGGGGRGESARRALSGVLRALTCSVCAATAARPLTCARSHLYCTACWSRLERCALCREPLPAQDSPYARNLVAEQVFEAIATEYEIKNTLKKQRETVSAQNTPNRTPNLSPAVSRRGQYQHSMMHKKKAVQFTERGQNFSSDPNIHRSLNHELTRQTPKTTNNPHVLTAGNTECKCQVNTQVPHIRIEDTDVCESNSSICSSIQHKLVSRLRPACSLADLQNIALQSCQITRSLNSLGDCNVQHTASLENLKNTEGSVILLPSLPIYVLPVPCDQNKN
ncbi:unnamed protein product [Chilo suppressalis]|uniref:PDZ domain-containing protein n=1 Tax=Chilo suppressalis TaxID=168631 RepID=A0ABN8LBW6_CHISP|nr:unnamed protein product [Chilo suppressalis]